MFESIIRQNPLLSGIVAVVVAVLVLLFVSALISGWRNRRRSNAIRREPVLGRGRPERDEFRRIPGEAGDPEGRRRFGGAAVAVAFIGGLLVGAGGLVLSQSGQFAPVLDALAGLVGAGPTNARETVAEVPPPVAAPTKLETEPLPASPSPAGASGDVKTRLAVFAGKLKGALPRAAGPEMVLNSVEATGMTLHLGYSIGRVMADAEIPEFDAYIMKTIKSLFCGREAQEIRYLNDGGVAFHMIYADPRGQTVAKLTVPPQFCA